MSEIITTLNKDIFLTSIAFSGNYHLSVIQSEEELVTRAFSYQEYCNLLKKLWNDYINNNQKPELLGQTLTDEGFVGETLHFIAPNVFYASDCGPLDEDRESFIYWLKSNYNLINNKINKESLGCLDRNLESILRLNLEKKKK